MPFKKPDPKPNFSELENRINQFWKDNTIFEKSVKNREGADPWHFYDGPPFISGTPHFGHMKDFAVKDAIPRYWTMKGYHAPRVWGWDCHGLPIENKVEKKLNIRSKVEVDKLGVDKFIEDCYDYTRTTSAEWVWYIEKMGRWIDYDHAYRTMDQDYMETVWWVFKSLWDKGLLYKGWRSSLYSTDSATPVSNFEIAMDNLYEDVVDDSLTVKFKLKKTDKFNSLFKDSLEQIGDSDVSMLAWTTTAWTIPSNFALGVNPKEDYALIETSSDNSEVTARWIFEQAPFDMDKYTKATVEEYFLSFKNEKVTSEEQLKKSSKNDFDSLTELELSVIKIAKKFYFREGEDLSEISQHEFQKLSKEAKNNPVRKQRIYYPVGKNTINIDFYQADLEGLQIAEVQFNSPIEYDVFKKSLPEWFGKEVTNSSVMMPENLSKTTFNELLPGFGKYEEKAGVVDTKFYKQYVILATQLAEANIKGDYKVISTFKGSDLEGLEYEQIYNFYPTQANDLHVYAEDIVTVEDGTGVLHLAPAFGEEDFEVGKKHKLSFLQCIDDLGNMLPETGPFAGMYLRDACLPIINDLKKKGKLYKTAKFTHRLPFYRYENPLIYRAQESWFVNIQKIKKDLFAQNENINWIPDHLKTGRFAKGIETAPDWGVSRSRYWATSMPVWVEEDPENPGKVKENYAEDSIFVAGSRDEIKQNAIDPITKIKFVISQTEGIELAKKLTEKTTKLAEKISTHKISDFDETFLVENFKEDVEAVKKDFAGFIKSIEGKESDYKTTAEHLALLRYVYEGKTLKESFANLYNYTSDYYMYFFKDGLLNLHRNVIDKVKLKHPKTGKTLVRLPDVLDSWLDSGSMPFAQMHYPFENKDLLDKNYPADFIVEYIAQTRAWFYVMHVLGTALTGKNAFKNAVTTGVIAGTDGRKMSKTYGNYPDPKLTLENYGAEAIRWYFLTSKLIIGEDIKIDEKNIRDQLRLYLIPLWNIYSFFTTYAQLHDWKPTKELISNSTNTGKKVMGTDDIDTYWYKVPDKKWDNELDQWIIALLQKTCRDVRVEMDAYYIPKATRLIQDFADTLSRGYIRRSRERFAQGDTQALDTLYYILVELTKLTAPFTPFVAEELYQNLVKEQLKDEPESVHLCDYPEADMDYLETHATLLQQMQMVQTIIDLGQSLRTQHNLKLRQPLNELEIKINSDSSQDWDLKEWMKDLIAQELNVNTVQEKHQLTSIEGYLQIAHTDGNTEIALDTRMTPELKQRGIYRDLVRSIQALRKKSGLSLGDKINLICYTEDKELINVIKSFLPELIKDVTANEISIGKKLDDSELSFQIDRAK